MLKNVSYNYNYDAILWFFKVATFHALSKSHPLVYNESNYHSDCIKNEQATVNFHLHTTQIKNEYRINSIDRHIHRTDSIFVRVLPKVTLFTRKSRILRH